VIPVFAAAASFVICLSFAYLWLLFGLGVRQMHRTGSTIAALRGARYEDPFIDDPETFFTYFLVPCLNEERVIGATVAALAGSATSTTIVIDDASDDATIECARAHGGPNLVVLARKLPDARKGKGEALNDAVRLVRELADERGQDRDRVLVVVMDADGRLSDGALSKVVPLFEDPAVGAAQLAVRIRNRQQFLTRFQDYHFWSLTAITQIGRGATSTVSLGGNGQFSRLSALDVSGVKPWSESLTEDLDLAVTMLVAGWRLVTTAEAAVEQQGVDTVKVLFRQRRRWFQGHMMMAKRVPEIWRTDSISNLQALEISAYIMQPWLVILPWSILFHWAVLGFPAYKDAFFAFVHGSVSFDVGITIWYLLTFGPVVIGAWVYYKRDEDGKLWRALWLAHCFPLMNYLAFMAVWSALARILKGENGWQKTVRVAENLTATPGADASAPSAAARALPRAVPVPSAGDGGGDAVAVEGGPVPTSNRPATTMTAGAA
jgi:cellulose synthase/poly-beta-1,6-N-acetylglucosamine synthase-like glycosyltransferase